MFQYVEIKKLEAKKLVSLDKEYRLTLTTMDPAIRTIFFRTTPLSVTRVCPSRQAVHCRLPAGHICAAARALEP